VALDLDRAHDIYHDDLTGERISGERNLYELRAHYPAKLTFKILRIRGVNVVTIMEFKDGKVAHETHYYADPFEPPEWRSQWVQRM
jgi:hypothetical protein